MTGVLILVNLAFLTFIAVFIYAQVKIRPLMGAGPSVSEFLEPFINAIFQLTAVGLAGLLITYGYWRFALSRSNVEDDQRQMRMIRISLILVPLWLMFVYYVSKVYAPDWLSLLM